MATGNRYNAANVSRSTRRSDFLRLTTRVGLRMFYSLTRACVASGAHRVDRVNEASVAGAMSLAMAAIESTVRKTNHCKRCFSLAMNCHAHRHNGTEPNAWRWS
jgi:hypothetical protein